MLYALDLLLDNNLKVWLMEVNDNPGIVSTGDIEKYYLPKMIDEMVFLTVD